MGHRLWVAAVLGLVGALAVGGAACGDRTALPGDLPLDATLAQDAIEVPDVAVDAPLDAGDVAADAPFDSPFDIHQGVPIASDCPDAAATLVYVITETHDLYSFYPPTGAFTFIGAVRCPGSSNEAWSMAVDRRGRAYVLYQASGRKIGGPLFEVDTATAHCERLPYRPDQDGFQYFGMGFASNDVGASETLYIQGDTYSYTTDGGSSGLASLDTTTWKVTPIGPRTSPLSGGELTGTGGGDLFVFFKYASDDSVPYLGQLDKATGALTAKVELPASEDIASSSFAMAYWGGDFYLFTNHDVAKYSSSTGKTQAKYARLGGGVIVGAGVSTCAPP